jgi:hypothetical protein
MPALRASSFRGDADVSKAAAEPPHCKMFCATATVAAVRCGQGFSSAASLLRCTREGSPAGKLYAHSRITHAPSFLEGPFATKNLIHVAAPGPLRRSRAGRGGLRNTSLDEILRYAQNDGQRKHQPQPSMTPRLCGLTCRISPCYHASLSCEKTPPLRLGGALLCTTPFDKPSRSQLIQRPNF